LVIIIRDWKSQDHFGTGLSEGERYIKEILKPSEGRQRQLTSEHKNMYIFMNETFKDISCLLLPCPGDAVKNKHDCRIGGKYRPFI